MPKPPPQTLHYLVLDRSEGDDGHCTLEAVASTRADTHAAARAEAQALLDWFLRTDARGHGPLEDGGRWWEDLAVAEEPGGWFSVALTVALTPELLAVFEAQWTDEAA